MKFTFLPGPQFFEGKVLLKGAISFSSPTPQELLRSSFLAMLLQSYMPRKGLGTVSSIGTKK